MVFTDLQKAFIIESYFKNGERIKGEWKYSVDKYLSDFRIEYPNVARDYQNFRSTVSRCVSIFRETVSAQRKKGSGLPKKRTPELISNTENVMTETPRTSIRVLSQQAGASVGTCHTILKEDNNLFPYRLTCFQKIEEVDYPRRMAFCQWFLNR